MCIRDRGNTAGAAFSVVHTGQEDRLYLVAGVLGVPLVHYIEERSEVIILWLVAIHITVDCNKAYLLLGEQYLGIKADFKIVSTETAHILDDNRADFSSFGFCKHCLKSGTVKVTPCVTVIGKMLDVRHTAFAGKIFEKSLLRQDLSRVVSAKMIFFQKQ